MMGKTGDWSASADVLGQFFYIIIIFVIVTLIFLFCARWLVSMRKLVHGKNLRIIESCYLTPQSSVRILQAGERLFLIGVTKDRIDILAEITGQTINAAIKPHAAIFEQYLKRYAPPETTKEKEDSL